MTRRAPHESSLQRTHAAAGEPFVWLTAAGLAIGVLMIVALLGVILFNGLPVFWPSRVVSVELRPGVEPVLPGARTILGEVVTTRLRSTPILQEDGTLAEDQTEIQFFVGNKEVYGFGFVYIDRRDLEAFDYPVGVMAIERIEHGDAFGFPVALLHESGERISADDPEFDQRLQRAIREVSDRRREIERIEKREIGAINRKMTKLRVEENSEAAAELNDLDAQYQELAQQAKDLRARQNTDRLLLRLPTGVEHPIFLGNILHAIYPNQLGLLERTALFLQNVWGFLSLDPREANTEGGVFPAIFGTFVMTLLMSVAVVPFGVVAAIYLREYARQGIFVRSVRIAVNNLAGVPSIVFGVFGLGFFVYFVGGVVDRTFFPDFLPTPTFGTGGILWASLTLALMTVPVVIVATEEAISAVPRGMKEGSLACGASKWQTIQRIVLPASLPGILTGMILAMARGAGEVAPLMLVGVVKLAPSLPLDGEFPFIHLERKFMHLGFHIYDLGFQSPDSEAAKPMVFATTLLLILLVILLNLAAILIRERLRKKFATGAF